MTLSLFHLSEDCFPILVDVACKGTLLLMLAMGAAAVARRASAAARHLLWACALGALLLLPVLSIALPAWRVLPHWTALPRESAVLPVDHVDVPPVFANPLPASPLIPPAPAVAPPAPVDPLPVTPLPVPVQPPAVSTEVPTPPVVPASLPATLVPPAPLLSIPATIVLLYFAGTCLTLLPLLVSPLLLHRLRRRSAPLADESWQHLLAALAGRLGISRKITLLQSRSRSVPMTFGTFRPVILLPADAATWSLDRRRMVLLHELAHIQRRDCLVLLLARLVRALYWFHPLAHVAAARLSVECERACDDTVLALGTPSADYASELLSIASTFQPAAPAAALAMARPSTLEGRLLRILDGKLNRKNLTRTGALIIAAVMIAVTMPLACMKAGAPEVAAKPEPVAAKDDWSPAVAGLQARLLLQRHHVTNGTPILKTFIDFRNLSDHAGDLQLPFSAAGVTFHVVDAAGKDVPAAYGPYDGFIGEHKDHVIPRNAQISVDVSAGGAGIPGDQAALIDLGPRNTWILPRDGKEYYLQATLDIPSAARAAADRWHGRIELPRIAIPTKTEPITAEEAGKILDQWGPIMLRAGRDSSEAMRRLSLVDDPRVIPWYVKAIDTGNSNLMFSALDRLGRFNDDQALAGIKRVLTFRGSDMTNVTENAAEQSAASTRHSAAIALARSPHKDAKALLLTMQHDSYDAVRLTVLQTFCEAKSPEARALIKDMLEDPNESVRGEAARYQKALAATAATAPAISAAGMTVETMLEKVTHPDAVFANLPPVHSEVRLRLVGVTGKDGYVPQKSDETKLLAAMQDAARPIYVRLCAASFLLQLDNEAARTFIDEKLATKDPRLGANMRETRASDISEPAAALVGDIGPGRAWSKQRAIAALARNAKVHVIEDPWVPAELCRQLVTTGEKDAIAAVLAVVDTAAEVDTFDLLATLDDPQIVPAMTALLEKKDGTLNVLPARVLVKKKTAGIGKFLIRHLGEYATADLLLELNDPATVPPLEAYARQHLDDIATQRALILLSTKDRAGQIQSLVALAGKIQNVDQRDEFWITLARNDKIPQAAAAIRQRMITEHRPGFDSIWALADLATPDALATLVDMLDLMYPDQDLGKGEIRKQADWIAAIADALQKATGQKFGSDTAKWKAWLKEQAATRPAGELTLDLGDKLAMKLIEIPAGKFLMGTPEDKNLWPQTQIGPVRPDDEMPQHEVAISRPFFMGVYPVTQEQYFKIMGDFANGSTKADHAKHPVSGVSRVKAIEFCEKLSAQTGRIVRLPTEAEWEYAARAGTTSRSFYGNAISSDYDRYAWLQNSKDATHPVGEKLPNPWGLYDIYGNVGQWCSDWYAKEYDAKPQTDPTGPAEGKLGVLRGGCRWDFSLHTGSPMRWPVDPNRGGADEHGLRVVVELAQPAATTSAADTWSKPVNGLVGRLIAEKTTIAPADAFTITLELRNTTDHSLSVQSRNPFCFATTLKDAAGKSVDTHMGRSDVTYSAAFATIEPGKTLSIPFAHRNDDGGKKANLDTVTSLWTLPPGGYSLAATFTPFGNLKDVHIIRMLVPADMWMGTLELPPIALEVAAPAASTAPVLAPKTREAAVNSFEAQLKKQLPENWTLTRSAGTFTPEKWVDAGKGEEFVITQPNAAAGKSEPLHLYLMAPGYSHRSQKFDESQAAPAADLIRWQGGPVVTWGGYDGDNNEWTKLHNNITRILIETDPSLQRDIALAAVIKTRLAKLADDLAFLNDEARAAVPADPAAGGKPAPRLTITPLLFRNGADNERGSALGIAFNMTPETPFAKATPVNADAAALRMIVSLVSQAGDPAIAVSGRPPAAPAKFQWDGKSTSTYMLADHWQVIVIVQGNRPDTIKKTHAVIDAAINELLLILRDTTAPSTSAATRAAADITAANFAAAILKARADHADNAFDKWQALAKLVTPGMNFGQLRQALPPEPGFLISWNGTIWQTTYKVDANFQVEAFGTGARHATNIDSEMTVSSVRIQLAPAARPADRSAALKRLVELLDTDAANDWSAALTTGQFTPAHWDKQGAGALITITVPRKGREGFESWAARIWLMEPGYDGKLSAEPAPARTEAASAFATWRGGPVFVESLGNGYFPTLNAALAQTDVPATAPATTAAASTHPLDDASRDLANGVPRQTILDQARQTLAAPRPPGSIGSQYEKLPALVRSIELALAQQETAAKFPADSPERLVATLIDSTHPSHWQSVEPMGGFTLRSDPLAPGQPLDIYDQVRALGDKAISALIAQLDNRAATRVYHSLHSGFDKGGPVLLYANELSLSLLEEITGCYFDFSDDGIDHPTNLKKHVTQWWAETAGKSRAERMQWQYPHARGLLLENMHAVMLKEGMQAFAKADLLRRFKADGWNDTVCRLLADMGEFPAFDICIKDLQDPKRTYDMDQVYYLLKHGGQGEYKALAESVRLRTSPDPTHGFYPANILRAAAASKSPHAWIVLEALLSLTNKDTESDFHAPAGAEQSRYCDAFMDQLAREKIAAPFDLTWPLEKRDAAIRQFIADRKAAKTPATAPATAATAPAAKEDGILVLTSKLAAAPFEKTLPPSIVVTAKNTTAEAIRWNFLSSTVVIDGQSQPAFSEMAGPVDIKWSFLRPGESFTRTHRLPDSIWRTPGEKKIQWITQAHATNTISLSWQADAAQSKPLLAMLAKSRDGEETLSILRALGLIGRDSLIAGLRDVLAVDRAPFAADSYPEQTRIQALSIVGTEKIAELTPELTLLLKQKKSPAIVAQTIMTFYSLPQPPAIGDITPLANSADHLTRRYLAGLLGHAKIERAGAVALLHQMLDAEDTQPAKTYEEHAFIKIWAAQSLGHHGDNTAVPMLVLLLQNKESASFRGNIRSVLQEITGQKFTTDQEWIDWSRKTFPAAAATSAPTFSKFRQAALNSFEIRLKKELPEGWTLTRRSGTITPERWPEAGEGEEFVVTQPKATADGKSVSLHIYLMAPGYAVSAPEIDRAEGTAKAPATVLFRWQGGHFAVWDEYLRINTDWAKHNNDWTALNNRIFKLLVDTDPSLQRDIALGGLIQTRFTKLAADLAFLNEDSDAFIKAHPEVGPQAVPKVTVTPVYFRGPFNTRGGTLAIDFNMNPNTMLAPAKPVVANAPALRLFVTLFSDAGEPFPSQADATLLPAGKLRWDGTSTRETYILADHWRLTISVQGNRPEVIKKSRALIDAALNDLVPAITNSATVTGRVLDHRGKPVANATVCLPSAEEAPQDYIYSGTIEQPSNPSMPIGPKTTTDADGHFSLPLSANSADHVLITAPNYLAWVAAVAREKENNVTLPEPASLVIRYDIPGAPPIAEFDVMLYPDSLPIGKNRLYNASTSITLANGKQATITNLTPGRYDIQRRKAAGNTNIPLDWPNAFNLTSGERKTVDFIRQGFSVEGAITNLRAMGLTAATITVTEILPVPATTPSTVPAPVTPKAYDIVATTADGGFKTETLASGRYTLTASGLLPLPASTLPSSPFRRDFARFTAFTARLDITIPEKTGKPLEPVKLQLERVPNSPILKNIGLDEIFNVVPETLPTAPVTGKAP